MDRGIHRNSNVSCCSIYKEKKNETNRSWETNGKFRGKNVRREPEEEIPIPFQCLCKLVEGRPFCVTPCASLVFFFYREFHLLFVSDFSDTALVRFPVRSRCRVTQSCESTFRCPTHETQAQWMTVPLRHFTCQYLRLPSINSSLSLSFVEARRLARAPRTRRDYLLERGPHFPRKSNVPSGMRIL